MNTVDIINKKVYNIANNIVLGFDEFWLGLSGFQQRPPHRPWRQPPASPPADLPGVPVRAFQGGQGGVQGLSSAETATGWASGAARPLAALERELPGLGGGEASGLDSSPGPGVLLAFLTGHPAPKQG